jgi:hypothetical protein
MPALSRLELTPHHRPGGSAGGATRTECWTWDFVVDGQPLSVVAGDMVGALGSADPAWDARVVDKLLRRAPPDLPPDRVALYVCPECGDLGCGAVAASVIREGDVVIWRDFAWERDWEDALVQGQPIELGPFHFDRGSYGRLLRAALERRPGPDEPPIVVA